VSPRTRPRRDDTRECDAPDREQQTWPELDEQAIILTGPDRASIRAALSACSKILAWARQHGGPAIRDAINDTDITRPVSAGTLEYDVNLYIDYLDFAKPATRRTQRSPEV
jgi:hypothetical protein